ASGLSLPAPLPLEQAAAHASAVPEMIESAVEASLLDMNYTFLVIRKFMVIRKAGPASSGATVPTQAQSRPNFVRWLSRAMRTHRGTEARSVPQATTARVDEARPSGRRRGGRGYAAIAPSQAERRLRGGRRLCRSPAALPPFLFADFRSAAAMQWTCSHLTVTASVPISTGIVFPLCSSHRRYTVTVVGPETTFAANVIS